MSDSCQDFEVGVFDSILSNQELQTIKSYLAQHSTSTRRLFNDSYFKELAKKLRSRVPSLRELIPVFATYFYKTKSSNWLVAPHQDIQIPIVKAEMGDWKTPTLKEGIPFIQAPHEVLSSCINLRLQIDPHSDGDLQLHRRAGIETPVVPVGGALHFCPLQVHSSQRLKDSHSPRRVVQILYGPEYLPEPYQWFQFHA